MSKNERNPEHEVTQAMREHWHKVAALILFKLSPDKEVVITPDDLVRVQAAFDGGVNIVVQELDDGLHIRLVTAAEGTELLAAERAKRH
jgi:hypothetical protein